ncbi:MAG: hypothetical protein FWE98_04630, partial [Oscillospiraceae bacterium]|nr:hypothetical protein [Oscillospiraceae bacterium]
CPSLCQDISAVRPLLSAPFGLIISHLLAFVNTLFTHAFGVPAAKYAAKKFLKTLKSLRIFSLNYDRVLAY